MEVNRRNYIKKYVWPALDMYSSQEYRGGTIYIIIIYML